MSKYGQHFERSTIMQHLESGKMFCPITGNPLRPSSLVSNKTLQWKIKYWAEKNGIEVGTDSDAEIVAPIAGDNMKTVGFLSFPPERFHCPLTRRLMKDPVMTKQGINYERNAILKWLDCSAEELCPVTSTPLSRRGLVSNPKLQWEIEQWEQKYGMAITVQKKSSLDACCSSHSTTLSGSELVCHDMLASSMLRPFPGDLYNDQGNSSNVTNEMASKKRLMDALNTAINCSLHA